MRMYNCNCSLSEFEIYLKKLIIKPACIFARAHARVVRKFKLNIYIFLCAIVGHAQARNFAVAAARRIHIYIEVHVHV